MDVVFPDTFVAVVLLLDLVATGNHWRYAEQMDLHQVLDVRVPELYTHDQGRRRALLRQINYHGRTPLHLAAMHGHHEIIRLILISPRISAEVVNARDHFGYTPLHLAVRSQRQRAVMLLTRSGLVLPNRLIAATCHGPDEIEQQCGPHYNCRDENNLEYEGYTPLHVAAFTGNSGILHLLLQLFRQAATGSDPITTTWRGRTPLDIANEKGFTHIVELIENSDVAWMHSERGRNANSVNAILVGAALVAAVTFSCWQQPPLGIPDPGSYYSLAEGQDRTKRMAMFFVGVSLAFAFSVAALVVGTLAVMPSRGVALMTEVKHLRRAVRQASSLLVVAILWLLVAFHLGGSLVYKIVAFADLGLFSSAANQIVNFIPYVCLLYVWWWVFRMKRVHGSITRYVVLLFVIAATTVHVLEFSGHVRVLLVGTKPRV